MSNDNTQEHIEHDYLQMSHSCLKCSYSLDGIDLSGACPECGTPIIGECIECAYDLSGTDPNGVCPECGVPAHCSIGHSALGGVSTEQLKSVHTGFRLVTNLILAYVIYVVFGFIAGVMLMSGRQGLGVVAEMVLALISDGLILGILIGWLKLSQPLAGVPKMLDTMNIRAFVRVLLWIYVVLTVLSLIYSLVSSIFFRNDSLHVLDWVFFGVAMISLLLMIVMFVSHVLYIGWVARLVRNKKMYKRSKHFVWTGPVIAVLGSFLLMLGPLIALVMYWNLIEYVRRDLKKIIKARSATA